MRSGWENRYGWFWYDYKEIFGYDRERMRRAIKPYADAGITVIIGFSVTHFRWSYYRYWDSITACIKLIAQVCHEYGIKYVEHHSCTLTSNPQNAGELKRYERFLAAHGSLGFLDGVLEDAETLTVGGKSAAGWRQISGRTGKPGVTPYRGFAMCYNNPEYRKAYLDYLETLYEAGIDGIMTDDVQYFGNDGMGWKAFNACTCEHCRRLFREETGYEIPGPEGWEKFYGDYKNPVFVAWKKFKDRSTERFVREVQRHFESQGYSMLRPNYVSNFLQNNLTAYPFEACADLWDCAYQENCEYDVIAESLLVSAAESLHRYHMAKTHGVPGMAQYYPCTDGAAYFCWALGVSQGLLVSLCYQPGAEVTDLLSMTDFHKKHFECYDAPEKISDVTFLLSQSTRDYSPENVKCADIFMRWLQAAMVSGFMPDMLFEKDPQEEYLRSKVIAVCAAEMPAAGTAEKLRRFAESGGTLIIIGDFDIYGEDGRPREPAAFEEGPLGRGRVIRLAADACLPDFQDRVECSRGGFPPHSADSADKAGGGEEKAPDRREPERVPGHRYCVDGLRETGGKALAEHVTRMIGGAGEDLAATLFRVGDGWALHLLNVEGKPSRGGKVSHLDPVRGFEKGNPPVGGRVIEIALDAELSSVEISTPEREETAGVGVARSGGKLRLRIPDGFFSGYALVHIKAPVTL